MFDDLKKDENTQTQQPATPQPTVPAPPVAPVSPQPAPVAPATPVAPAGGGGGIDDMFADVDPAPASAVEKPSAIQSGKIAPVSQNPPPASGQPPATPSASDMIVAEGGGGGPLKKIIAIIIVIFILGLAGGAVYYFMNRNVEDTGGENINVTNDVPEDNANTNTDTNIDDNDFDDDFDGLSNAEEKSLGTDINNADTDNDGLFDAQEVNEYNTNPLISDTDLDGLTDYEEVETYGTDPNNVDTDDDGYQDGVEVGNGYNPLGEGMLEGDDIEPIGDDVVYTTYTKEEFAYSVSRPGIWTLHESDFSDEEYNMSEVQFWPGVFGIGSHHIRVSSARLKDFTEEKKQEYLAIEDSWEDYTLGGLPAHMSPDRYRTILFRPTAEEGTMDVFVLIYDYSLAGEPNAEYMIIFQEMLNSFTFLTQE